MRTLLVAAPLGIGLQQLAQDEARHGVAVLRLQVGETVRLADGAGRVAEAQVVLAERSRLHCLVHAVTELPPTTAELLEVALAAPKGSLWDDLLRDLTELGVGSIRPLRCARGSREPRDGRAERICQTALKQCGRARLPQVLALSDIATCLGDGKPTIVLDPQGTYQLPGPPQATRLLVGPEGGFSPEEQQLFAKAGVMRMALVPTILRIATAAVAASAVLLHAWECHERSRPRTCS